MFSNAKGNIPILKLIKVYLIAILIIHLDAACIMIFWGYGENNTNFIPKFGHLMIPETDSVMYVFKFTMTPTPANNCKKSGNWNLFELCWSDRAPAPVHFENWGYPTFISVYIGYSSPTVYVFLASVCIWQSLFHPFSTPHWYPSPKDNH